MNCAYHWDRPVQGVCSTCGRPVCEECTVNLNGQVYCKPCIEQKVRTPANTNNGALRFILSFFPGLGHLYLGLFQRGFQLMGAAILGGIIGSEFFEALGPFLVIALIFYSIFDAREAHMRILQGLEVDDKGFVDLKNFKWEQRYIGYILVGLGVLALYNVFLDDFLYLLFRGETYFRVIRMMRGATVGVLAILAGVFMLKRNYGGRQ